MLRAVPWLVSFLVHAAIVAVTLFVVWSTVASTGGTVIPDVSLGDTPRPALRVSQIHPTLRQKKNHQSTAQPKHQMLNKPLDLASNVIGLQSDGAASASPFSMDTGESGETATSFFGAKGSAHRIVFVVDASGSLIDTLPFVLQELQRTIVRLSPVQSFAVIFFRGANVFPKRSVIEAPPMGMTIATPKNKDETIHWLIPRHIQAGGRTNPLAALRRAMRYRPQLIYLLSDNITGSGAYQLKQKKLLSEIKAVNTIKAKIDTIQFLYRDPLDRLPGRTDTMKLIAKQTGGRYKFVSSQQLDLK